MSLEKYLLGGAAGRRTSVDALGDSLRAWGAVRVEGHGVSEEAEAAELERVARTVLQMLEEYFGLAAGSVEGLLAKGAVVAEDALEPTPSPHLLALWRGPEVTELEAVLPGGEGLPAGAREGELVVSTGPGLAAATHGVVPAGCWRRKGEEGAGEEGDRGRRSPAHFLALPRDGREPLPLPQLLGA